MSSHKPYRPWNPDESFLFPPSPREWLPEGHLAFFILDTVQLLDLSGIEDALQAKDPRGVRPYDPAMMVAVLLYAYCTGTYSSRRIERATYEDVAFRVLAGQQHPDHSRISAFRKSHLDALAGLFKQVLLLCRKAGLVKLGHVALDGTKLQGNASKHKAMSYERMTELERRLEEEVRQLLARAHTTDAAEDERLGADRTDQDVPAELRRREDRLARLRQAKAELEAEARQARAARLREMAESCDERASQAAEEPLRKANETRAKKHRAAADGLDGGDDGDEPPFTTPDGLPMHRPPTTPAGKPAPRAQRNFTDPDSRIMESGGGYLQGYNAQAVVDEGHQIIVANALTNQPPDAGNLLPMLRLTLDNCEQPPQKLTADSGFWSPDVPAAAAALGTEALIATERHKHWASNGKVTEGEPPKTADARERMRHKLRTQAGRAVYARRKAVVEPVFGQIKEARGFRRFLLRGLHAVAGEWSLLCTVHNLLKLFRVHGRPALA